MSHRTPSSGPPHPFVPAWWVPGAHLQTLWGKFARRPPRPPWRIERWRTPDDDEVELHRVDAPPGRPHLLLLHGLEGGPQSHYVGGLLDQARRRGWGAELLVFRSCGPVPNRARRFYHSGETEDLALVVDRLAAEHPGSPLLVAGVSLGGNVLLKYLGERGDRVPAAVRAAAAVSVPYDLGRGSRHIGRGFGRVYERHFVRSLRRKALEKLARYPDLYASERLAAARSLLEFDDVVTAPVHGFASADDYYDRSSSLRFLAGIRRPTLLLSAEDDPFLPAEVLDEVRRVARGNDCLDVDFVPHGGHAGFVGGRLPWRPVYWAENRVIGFLAEVLAGGDASVAGTPASPSVGRDVAIPSDEPSAPAIPRQVSSSR